MSCILYNVGVSCILYNVGVSYILYNGGVSYILYNGGVSYILYNVGVSYILYNGGVSPASFVAAILSFPTVSYVRYKVITPSLLSSGTWFSPCVMDTASCDLVLSTRLVTNSYDTEVFHVSWRL